MIDYIERQIEWSRATFGEGRRTGGLTKHIAKELDEIRAEPLDVEEWCDVVILALDGAWRAGYTAEEIMAALQAKQTKNMGRVYPRVGEDEASEHIET